MTVKPSALCLESCTIVHVHNMYLLAGEKIKIANMDTHLVRKLLTDPLLIN